MHTSLMVMASLFLASLSHAAMLGIPSNGATLSGIGVISGWKCQANGPFTVRFDGGPPVPLVYGSERPDTHGVCGDANNGFVAIWNWGRLDDGRHTAVVYDNGVEFDRSNFTVATLGEEFARGLSGTYELLDFPRVGINTTIQWTESTQHFETTETTSASTPPPEPISVEEQQLQGLIGTWTFTVDFSAADSRLQPQTRQYRIESLHKTDAGVLAVGTDPVDNSTLLATVSDSSEDAFPFFLADVDFFEGQYFCYWYSFYQTGNEIEGYVMFLYAHGPEISQCDPEQGSVFGQFTGVRQE